MIQIRVHVRDEEFVSVKKHKKDTKVNKSVTEKCTFCKNYRIPLLIRYPNIFIYEKFTGSDTDSKLPVKMNPDPAYICSFVRSTACWFCIVVYDLYPEVSVSVLSSYYGYFHSCLMRRSNCVRIQPFFGKLYPPGHSPVRWRHYPTPYVPFFRL